MDVPAGWLLQQAAAIREAVDVPVVGVSRLTTPDDGEAALRDGLVDVVAYGRAFLTDPDWPRKAREGRAAEQLVLHRLQPGLRLAHRGPAGRDLPGQPGVRPRARSRHAVAARGRPGGCSSPAPGRPGWRPPARPPSAATGWCSSRRARRSAASSRGERAAAPRGLDDVPAPGARTAVARRGGASLRHPARRGAGRTAPARRDRRGDRRSVRPGGARDAGSRPGRPDRGRCRGRPAGAAARRRIRGARPGGVDRRPRRRGAGAERGRGARRGPADRPDRPARGHARRDAAAGSRAAGARRAGRDDRARRGDRAAVRGAPASRRRGRRDPPARAATAAVVARGRRAGRLHVVGDSKAARSALEAVHEGLLAGLAV